MYTYIFKWLLYIRMATALISSIFLFLLNLSQLGPKFTISYECRADFNKKKVISLYWANGGGPTRIPPCFKRESASRLTLGMSE